MKTDILLSDFKLLLFYFYFTILKRKSIYIVDLSYSKSFFFSSTNLQPYQTAISMNNQIKLLKQHEITALSIEAATKLLQTIKQLYPSAPLFISVYEVFQNSQKQQNKQSPQKNFHKSVQNFQTDTDSHYQQQQNQSSCSSKEELPVNILKITEQEKLTQERCQFSIHNLQEGLMMYENQNYSQAIQFFEAILKRFPKLKYSPQSVQQNIENGFPAISTDSFSRKQLSTLSNITFHLGNCYFRSHNYEMAVFFYKNQISVEEPEQTAKRYNNMGSCYAKLNKPRKSLFKYEQALKLYEKFPAFDKSNLLYNIGNMYLNFSMFSDAQQSFLRSIEQRKEKTPEKLDVLVKCYYYLAISQRFQGNLQLSIQNFCLAKRIAENAKENRNIHEKILFEIASTYEIMQDYHQALIFYKIMVEQIRMKGRCKIQLGQVYQKMSFIFKRLNQHSQHLLFKNKSLEEYRNKINTQNKGLINTQNRGLNNTQNKGQINNSTKRFLSNNENTEIFQTRNENIMFTKPIEKFSDNFQIQIQEENKQKIKILSDASKNKQTLHHNSNTSHEQQNAQSEEKFDFMILKKKPKKTAKNKQKHKYYRFEDISSRK